MASVYIRDNFHARHVLRLIYVTDFLLQVSFSYSKGPRDEWNILKIDGFDMKDDPKRYHLIDIDIVENFVCMNSAYSSEIEKSSGRNFYRLYLSICA